MRRRAARLQRLDDRAHLRRRCAHCLEDGGVPVGDAGRDPRDLVQGVRQHHLVQRRVEADRTDPVEVTGRPRHLQVWRAASTLAQQERAQPMACPKLVLLRSLSRPDEVAERFVFGIWHPHRRQGAGAGAPSELERIPTVGLHAIPGLHEHERRGDDVAVHPEAEQLPVQPGAGWAGLVAGTQP